MEIAINLSIGDSDLTYDWKAFSDNLKVYSALNWTFYRQIHSFVKYIGFEWINTPICQELHENIMNILNIQLDTSSQPCTSCEWVGDNTVMLTLGTCFFRVDWSYHLKVTGKIIFMTLRKGLARFKVSDVQFIKYLKHKCQLFTHLVQEW